jgi:arylsulfatase A-like enzyme
MQGINLIDEQAVKHRRAIFGECFTHDAVDLDRPAANLRWRWMIENHWKLIVPDGRNEPHERLELYDLAADPRETHDLAAQQPERLPKLRAQLDHWWNPDGGRP